MIQADWDPEFRSSAMAQVRSVGGFYRTVQASRIDQHRSADGPTFRIRCGDGFDGRVLFAVPPGPTPYRTVLVGLLDFQQIGLIVDGKDGLNHPLELAAGEEHVFHLETGPLGPGIHRLLLVFFDDDREPGLFGWHDLIADLYVGPKPTLTPPLAVDLAQRRDPAIATADYGVFLTTTADRMRLLGNTTWHPGLTVYASVYGSTREPDRPVAFAVFQNYRQLLGPELPRVMVTHAGAVTPVSVTLGVPSLVSESIRAIIMTNPDREIAPNGQYDHSHLFITLASQKGFVERSP
jgi:hypothetical protein